MKACFSGSFDPVTNGHMDIIRRAAALFDEVDVLIMENPRKTTAFTAAERKQMIADSLKAEGIANAKAVTGSGLTVDAVHSLGADVIVRGVRSVTDYEYEVLQATANRMLRKEIETLFLVATPELSYLSSSVIKEIVMNGGSAKGLVPDCILEEVTERLSH